MKYLGYAPVYGCCRPTEDNYLGRLYLCKKHGWKDSRLKAEGEQIKLEL